MSAPLVLLAAAVATWLLRVAFITMVPARRLPARLRDALGEVAPAVMAALIASHLVRGGVAAAVSTDVVALLVVALVAWRGRSLATTTATGVVAAALLRLV